MKCFENLIWIKNACETITPSSGLYLDDLDISIDELNKILDETDGTPELYIKRKIEFAWMAMCSEINTHFAKYFVQNPLLENQKIGFPVANQSVVNGSNNVLKGIEIEMVNSRNYLDVFISSISVFADKTGTINVDVYDLITGKKIDTIAVDAIAGEISIAVINKTYKSTRKRLNLIFVYDSTGINSTKTLLRDGYCGSCNGNQYSNRYAKFVGVMIGKDDPKMKSKLKTLTETGGISIEYSVQCNTSDWLCTFSNILAMPLLYKLGSEISDKALTSNRTNKKTLIDADKWQKRKDWFELKYRESLENMVQNIKPQTNDCFVCKSPIRTISQFGG